MTLMYGRSDRVIRTLVRGARYRAYGTVAVSAAAMPNAPATARPMPTTAVGRCRTRVK
jgi:hypothetical protein